MNSFTLKLIACIAMLIDHITVLFVPVLSQPVLYNIGRGIGRIAFPIFCYLIVEGFFYTKNIQKYLLRLLIFAVISEIPFDFAFFGFPSLNNVLKGQNVFFTLFIGLLTITVYNYILEHYRKQPVVFNVLAMLTILAGGGLAYLMRSDYTFLGIIIIVAFYVFHYSKVRALIAFFVIGGFVFYGINLCAWLAIPLLYFYNGKRGPKLKYAFYAFYPVHLLILGCLAKLI